MDYGRFMEPHVLRAIGRELLRTFAGRFATELAAKQAVLPAERLADKDYFAAWSQLLMSPEGLPDRMNDVLQTVREMGTPEGLERLKAAIVSSPLEALFREQATAEEIVLRVWLEAPALLARECNEQKLQRLSRFHYSRMKENPCAWGEQSAGRREHKASLIQHLDLWYAANSRGDETAVVEEYGLDGERWFLVRHGDTFTRSAKVEKREMEVLHYRPAKDDVVVFAPARNELRINARTKGEKDCYREGFGFFLNGFRDCFEETKTHTLEPLRKLGRAALECGDISALDKIVLTKLDLELGNGMNQGYTLRADDLFGCSWGNGGTDLGIPDGAKLTRAVFQVHFEGCGKPLELHIKPPSTLRLGRHAAAARVHEWLFKRGFKG